MIAAIYMATALVSRATNPEKIKTSDLTRNNKPTQIMASFIRQFVKAESMIVEDMDPADLFYTMMTETMKVR